VIFSSFRSSAYRFVRGGGAVYAAAARTLRNLFFFKSFKMYA
jgi:hypothetical protein